MIRLVVFFLAAVLLGSAEQAAVSLPALQREAEAALTRGDTTAAIAAAQRGLRQSSAWKEGLWLLAWSHFRDRRYADARPVAVRLLQLDQSAAAPWAVLGLCEFHAGDYAMAATDLQRSRALGLAPATGLVEAARYHAALALLLTRRPEQALLLLEEAVRTGERTPEVQLATGLAALRLPVLPRDVAAVLSADVRAAAAAVSDALHREWSGDRSAAAQRFREAVSRHSRVRGLQLAYASWLVSTADAAGAAAAFRAELAADPDSVEARLGIAWTALETGDVDAARTAAREAAALDPRSANARFMLGRVLLHAGDAAAAVPELEAARDLEPVSHRVRYALSQAYAQLDRLQEAEREAAESERLRSPGRGATPRP